MSKFKVGDRVRRVRESRWPEDYGAAGKEYDVISVEGFSGNIVVIAGRGAAAADAFELVPTQAAFKAGDRVRCVSVCGGSAFTVGETYTVRKVANGLVYVDELEFQAMFSDRFEPVAVAPATATLKIGDRVVFVTDNPNGGAGFGRAGDKVTVTAGPSESDSYGAQVRVTSPRGGAFEPLVPVTALRLDEPAAVASATAAPCAFEFVPFPQVGDAVLIPGVISAVNQSPRGTNYNIVFETQNRRMSLHFLEEDFILDEDGDDEGDCPCANNDNSPVPTGDTAKAFDALGDWLRAVAINPSAAFRSNKEAA